MRRIKLLTATAFALLTLVFLASPTPSHAQEPRYLHALSNLRQARGWLQSDHNPYTADARHHAIDEIDKGIAEVKRAAQDDGKNTNFMPPPSTQGQPGGAVRKAIDLLDAAYEDVKHGYDIPANQGIQTRALVHIGEARRICVSVLPPGQ